MAFVFNPIVGTTVPYSTLGTGFSLLREGEPLLTFSVLNSTDTTNTSGFGQLFNDGVLLSASPAAADATSATGPGISCWAPPGTTDVQSRFSDAYIDYPDVVIPTTRGSWCCSGISINTWWSTPDEPRAAGARSAAPASPTTTPTRWPGSSASASAATCPIASRPADTFGVGWYYAGTSGQIGPLITAAVRPDRQRPRRRVLLQLPMDARHSAHARLASHRARAEEHRPQPWSWACGRN